MTEQREIVKYVLENPGVLQSSLAKHFQNGSTSNINHAIIQLRKKKLMRRESVSRTFKLYIREENLTEDDLK